MAINLLTRWLPGRERDELRQQLREVTRVHVVARELYLRNEKQAQERIDRLHIQLGHEVFAHQATRQLLEEAGRTLLDLRVTAEDAAGRVRYLEQELRDMARSRDELIEIADNLRVELRLPRTGITTTRKRKR